MIKVVMAVLEEPAPGHSVAPPAGEGLNSVCLSLHQLSVFTSYLCCVINYS